MSDFVSITCCRCKEPFGMTAATYRTARARGKGFMFFCPHGHEQYFTEGDSEADKLRKERDRLKQNEAYLESRLREVRAEVDTERRRSAAARGQVTKLKKRAAAGVCPCCNRTFTDLARHMAGQHPDFISQPDEASHVH